VLHIYMKNKIYFEVKNYISLKYVDDEIKLFYDIYNEKVDRNHNTSIFFFLFWFWIDLQQSQCQFNFKPKIFTSKIADCALAATEEAMAFSSKISDNNNKLNFSTNFLHYLFVSLSFIVSFIFYLLINFSEDVPYIDALFKNVFGQCTLAIYLYYCHCYYQYYLVRFRSPLTCPFFEYFLVSILCIRNERKKDGWTRHGDNVKVSEPFFLDINKSFLFQFSSKHCTLFETFKFKKT
ncbi:hypothetical protein RFI_08198, partial [Reticulomyxa filosa]